MSDDYWDQIPTEGGDYVKFTEIGDSVTGEIIERTIGSDFNGEPCPKLVIRTETGDRILSAGQAHLKVKLKEVRPEVGDRIKVAYTANGDAKPGRTPAKLFDVTVERGAAAEKPKVTELA